MATLITFRPSLTGFVVPMMAGLVGLFGFFAGLSQGNWFTGLLAGAALGAIISFVAGSYLPQKMHGVLLAAAIVAVIGYFMAGVAGLVGGALLGAFFGHTVYWLYTGQYRRNVPVYSSSGQVLWHNVFRIGICGSIFFF